MVVEDRADAEFNLNVVPDLHIVPTEVAPLQGDVTHVLAEEIEKLNSESGSKDAGPVKRSYGGGSFPLSQSERDLARFEDKKEVTLKTKELWRQFATYADQQAKLTNTSLEEILAEVIFSKK